ncbi:glycosyltransferase family 4 protein [Polluticaenibacter yanchengensis]|uniref:Glycosyltransferase family 4 protein n=1 Tax=Polluticaenibacter yanchengensis TaxID=3014562 RepID=A0ABT4UIU4_9BACT|nr:glycosyltransferase family 4 protein [Chitinophagaceae bacterium LY-5]
MKIGFVSVIKENWGGSEEIMYAIAKEALKAGHEVYVSLFATDKIHDKHKELIASGAKYSFRRGYIVPNIKPIRRQITKVKNFVLDAIFNPYADFLSNKLDFIFYNNTAYAYIFDKKLFDAIILKSIPYSIITQGATEYYRPYSNLDIPYMQSVHRNAKLNYFLSSNTKTTLERQIGATINNFKYFTNPVNIDSLEYIDMPKNDTVNFATVAMLLVVQKGQDMLFETLSKPEWKNRKWVLNLYGAGPDEAFLKNLSKYYKIDEKVIFHGKVSNIRKVWETNHILVMPSIFEGMPLAMVEAMICGRPIITTDIAAHSEWIFEEKNGFLAAAPTEKYFNKALQKAWDLRDTWSNLGREGRKIALKKFNPDDPYNMLKENID